MTPVFDENGKVITTAEGILCTKTDLDGNYLKMLFNFKIMYETFIYKINLFCNRKRDLPVHQTISNGTKRYVKRKFVD